MDRALPSRSVTWIWIALDVLVVVAAYLGTLVLRLAGTVPPAWWDRFMQFMPLVVATFLGVNLVARAYSSDTPLGRVAAAGLIGSVIVFLANIALDARLPVSVTILGGLGAVLGFIGVRLATRRFTRQGPEGRGQTAGL